MNIALNVNDLPGIAQPRLSQPALVCAAVLHVAAVWWVLQSAPVAQTAREVVNYLKPINPMTVPEVQPTPMDRAPRAIQPTERPAQRPPAPPAPDLPQPAPVLAPTPVSKAVTPPLPEPTPPEPKKTETREVLPTPTPVTPRPEAQAPLKPIDAVAETPPMVEAPPLVVESLQPTVQRRTSRRDTDVQPLALPKSRQVADLPQLAPLAVLPDPVPEPAAPEPAAPAVPVLAPAPVPPPTAPVATAAPPRPSAITPAPPAPTAAPVVAGGAAAGGYGLTLPMGPPGQAGTGKPLSTTLYPNMMGHQPRQRSLSEMANEQLNGGRAPRDKLADGIKKAEVPDCISSGGNGGGGGLLAIITVPIAAARGKCLMPK